MKRFEVKCRERGGGVGYVRARFFPRGVGVRGVCVQGKRGVQVGVRSGPDLALIGHCDRTRQSHTHEIARQINGLVFIVTRCSIWCGRFDVVNRGARLDVFIAAAIVVDLDVYLRALLSLTREELDHPRPYCFGLCVSHEIQSCFVCERLSHSFELFHL